MDWDGWEICAVVAGLCLALLGHFVVSGLAIRHLWRLPPQTSLDKVLLGTLIFRLLLDGSLVAAHFLLPGEIPDPERLGGMTMERFLLNLAPLSVLLNGVIIFAAWRHRRNMPPKGPIVLFMCLSAFAWLELGLGLLTIFMPLFLFALFMYLLYQVIDR
ncbi:hypothetical protein [uncultured Desulfovibrio sp.]|uniref:Uncharacterized protein n=1 Tax=Candidatus Desulfovibrio intestinavium TaxID=2838534 RepID=A0A9D2HMC4_9BACT|nr:hypothetical protein [uncultured Desulfovibrio sp.]HJA78123.1 hypothetical protein [Candidatus Desulfovibrio intestinavium]